MGIWTQAQQLVGRPLTLVLFCTLGAAACEPEVGSPCDPSAKKVKKVLDPQPGTTNLVQAVSLDNCSEGYCASVEGSRGFCTIRCESDLECAGAGEGFTCGKIVEFGALACRDYNETDDCLTEEDPETGAKSFSKQPLLYCRAEPDVIAKRDKDYGRSE